jgi:hypothetical protein
MLPDQAVRRYIGPLEKSERVNFQKAALREQQHFLADCHSKATASASVCWYNMPVQSEIFLRGG